MNDTKPTVMDMERISQIFCFSPIQKHINRKLSEVVRNYVPQKMTGSLEPCIIFIWGFLKPLSQSFVKNKIYMECLDINT